MKKFIRDFFSTSNEINEDTVMGVLSFAMLVTEYFIGMSADVLYIMAGLVGLFFGVGALKK